MEEKLNRKNGVLFTCLFGHRLIFCEVILCSQFSFLLFTQTGEITFPAWAEIDMPTPELT